MNSVKASTPGQDSEAALPAAPTFTLSAENSWDLWALVALGLLAKGFDERALSTLSQRLRQLPPEGQANLARVLRDFELWQDGRRQ